jgi:two-component system LytT family response regulator
MQKKIKIAVVDDDETMHDILRDLYADSDKVEIKYCYADSRKFMQEAPTLDFDLCFLDISMPGLDGLTLAQLLKNKPFIFITGSEDKLKDALGLNPIDVVTKPFSKSRLDYAIEKAFKLIGEKIDHAMFNVAESDRKVKINLADIVFVDTDDVDPRHKMIVLNDGTKYTIMDCSMEELASYAPQLMQVNRRQLIALDNVCNMQSDVLAVKDAKTFGIPSEITLSRKYKPELKKRIFFK